MFLLTAPFQFNPATNPWFYFSSYTTHTASNPIKTGPKNSKSAQLSTKQRAAIIYAYKDGAT